MRLTPPRSARPGAADELLDDEVDEDTGLRQQQALAREVQRDRARVGMPLRQQAHGLGRSARAGTRAEAAQADLLVLSVPWQHLESATAGLAPLAGRIVIDTMNPVVQPGFRLAELGGLASSQVVVQA